MKISEVLVILLFFTTTFMVSQEDKMKWDADRPLSWKDFKGTPEKTKDYVASTNSGVSLAFASQTKNGVTTYTTEVTTYFYPKLSWYRPGNVSAYILKHEQTHFDISEIFGRRLRKQLAQLDQKDPDFKEKVQQLFSDNEYERVLFQSEFDLETDHSNFPDYERKWEQKVAELLKELDAYK